MRQTIQQAAKFFFFFFNEMRKYNHIQNRKYTSMLWNNKYLTKKIGKNEMTFFTEFSQFYLFFDITYNSLYFVFHENQEIVKPLLFKLFVKTLISHVGFLSILTCCISAVKMARLFRIEYKHFMYILTCSKSITQ